MPRRYTEDRFTLADLRCAADRYCNWGKWGPNDEYGTLNYITPEDVINAGKLIKKGKTFALGLNFDRFGPQKNAWGNRFNPIHLMLATGTDAVSGRQDSMKIHYADDMISMPLQCGTQWDALGQLFDEQMWNGYDARLVDADGAQRCGIEKVKDKMVGRGVLLDVARYLKLDYLEDGTAITIEDLEATARSQKVEIRRGDFVIFRTGQMEQRLAARLGGPTRAVMLRAWHSKPASGLPRSRLPPFARILGAVKCVPTRPTMRSSPGTGS